MSKKAKPFYVKLIRHLREWHRKLGIVAAFFLIFLSLTGIALNHTNAIGLAHQPITNNWLLDHYGIQPPSDVRFYQNNQLSVTNNLVWLNSSLLFESEAPVISMGKWQNFYVIATSNELYLYNLQGQLVDQLDAASGVPSDITGLSFTEQTLIVNTEQGYFQTDSDFFDWQNINTIAPIKWIAPSTATIEQNQQATLNFKAQYLTLERIVLDAHSGRIFGVFGVLFMDFVALLLILLSLSGIYIWVRYAKAKR